MIVAAGIKMAGIFDPVKQVQFKEFLDFTLKKEEKLSFDRFKKNVGISRRQWDMFKEANIDADVDWLIE